VDTLPLDQVFPNPNQARKLFQQEALEELAASIRERGVMEPIIVRPKDGKYEIIAGERRYRASKIAGKTDIPVIIKDLDDEEAAAESLLENFQREDLTVLEKARAVEQLLGMMSRERAARCLGCSASTLKRYLDLLDLPDVVQDELGLPPAQQATSGFSEGHARLLRQFNEDYSTQVRLLDKIKRERLTVEQLECLIEALQKAPERREAFLRIPLEATEEILKRSGVKLNRRRQFRKQTAEEFCGQFQKQSTTLGQWLDDDVIRYLNFEQMNQIMATATNLLDDVTMFVRVLRDSLKAQDFGFMETYVNCHLCGRRELIGSLKCTICGSILKRCADCGHYDAGYQQCGLHGFYVYASEAEAPTEDAHSCQCPDYKPRVEIRRVA